MNSYLVPKRKRSWVALVIASVFISLLSGMMTADSAGPVSPAIADPPVVMTVTLRAEVNDFLGKELAAHLSDIKTLDPPPDRVIGALTVGEFSWGTFMRALAAYADTTGTRELAGRNVAKWVGKIGLIEAKGGGKAFAQLYAALALRHFGRDLKTNSRE